MDLLEKFVTTATRAGAYGVIGILGARYHYQVRTETDPFAYTFGWIGLGTIFLVAISLNFWALLRAERDLDEWAGRDRGRMVVVFLVFGGLLAATGAVWFQVLGILARPLK